MASFGIYAAILILVVYFVIVFMFPPIMVLQQRHFNDGCALCKRDTGKSIV